MAESIRGILSSLISWIVAVLLLLVAVHTMRRSSPAQFLPWLKIKTEMLVDVKGFNMENSSLWVSCAFVFFLLGIVGLISNRTMALLYLFCIFPGSYFLYRRYKRILRKYLIYPNHED